MLEGVSSYNYWLSNADKNVLVLSTRHNKRPLSIEHYRVLVPRDSLPKRQCSVQYERGGRWTVLQTVDCATQTLVPHPGANHLAWYESSIRPGLPIHAMRLECMQSHKENGNTAVRIYHVDLIGEVLTLATAFRRRDATLAAALDGHTLALLILQNTPASLLQAQILIGDIPPLTADVWALAGVDVATKTWRFETALSAVASGALPASVLKEYKTVSKATMDALFERWLCS